MPEVIMPKMGDAMEEGTLLQWLKQDGETVSVGEVIAEIETDKSNVEIEAEDAGVLHIQAQPGAVVPVGKVIAVIGEDAVKANANGQANSAPPAVPLAAISAREPQRVRETAPPLSILTQLHPAGTCKKQRHGPSESFPPCPLSRQAARAGHRPDSGHRPAGPHYRSGCAGLRRKQSPSGPPIIRGSPFNSRAG